MRKFSHLTRTALLLFFLFGLDKVLAFVRAGVISRQYRDSVQLLDTFNAANNLPDALFALISGGALAMAFIPLLTDTLTKKDRAAAWDLFSRVANLAFVVTGLAALVVAVFAQQIADRVIVPGFPLDQRQLLADLMRLNLISTLIFSISGLVMASLQANQHFLLPALAPIAYNAGQIFGALVLVPHYGIRGLVFGVILGAVLHLLIQIPALVKFGFRWTPSLNLHHTGLLQALRLIAPRLLTMGGIQLMMIIRDNLASRLGQPGAVTSLTLGWMIMQVPETLLGTAIATALLPTLSELAARRDWEVFRVTLERALRVMLALTLPVAAVLIAGLAPLVRAVFGFDAADSTLITWTARVFLLTLAGYAVQETLARAFYARQEPLLPLLGVVARLVIYLAIGLFGMRIFPGVGAPVIAAAELALTVEAGLLFFLLNRRLERPLVLLTAIIKGLAASLFGGITAYGLALYLPGGAILTALAGMLVGGLIALLIVWNEFRLLFRL